MPEEKSFDDFVVSVDEVRDDDWVLTVNGQIAGVLVRTGEGAIFETRYLILVWAEGTTEEEMLSTARIFPVLVDVSRGEQLQIRRMHSATLRAIAAGNPDVIIVRNLDADLVEVVGLEAERPLNGNVAARLSAESVGRGSPAWPSSWN